jgi:hypothetical protein
LFRERVASTQINHAIENDAVDQRIMDPTPSALKRMFDEIPRVEATLGL